MWEARNALQRAGRLADGVMTAYVWAMPPLPIPSRFGGSPHRTRPVLAACVAAAGFVAGLCPVAPGLVAPAMASTAGASAWVEGRYAAARLLDGGPAADGKRLAGVEIRLAPHTVTYWRDPGDAGVPPRFDFAASDNLGQARVLYPAPEILDKGGVSSFGYRGTVVFPVEIVPKDAARPVTLGMTLDYAVCADICVPEKAEARLVLDAPATGDGTVRDALRAVPSPRRLGEPGPLRIDAVEPGADGTLDVVAATPAGGATLFAELPEPWYATASAARPQPDGRSRFVLTLPSPRPEDARPDAPMRLTLVGLEGAIEVMVPLDALLAKP